MSLPASAQDVAAPAKAKAVKARSASKSADKAPEADGGGQVSAPAQKKRDPAEAQRTLDSGIKLLQAGKAEQAIQSFTVVISGGNLPSPLMARALHQRGAAYRAAGKPALALSDLTSALWLKSGLTDTDRADAIQQRSAAYREAGLPDQTDADGKPAGTATPRRASASPSSVGSGVSAATTSATGPATASVATASLAPETTPSQAASASTPLGNLFTNLFGGGTSAAAVAAPASRPSAQSTGVATAPAVTSGWSSATAVAAPRVKTASAASASASAPVVQSVASAATPAKAVIDGGIHARMIVRSEADGTALANRLKGEFSAQLAGRSASVSQAQFGGMGSFFQVRVGPYKTPAEAQDFCKRVKTAGADCVAVTQ